MSTPGSGGGGIIVIIRAMSENPDLTLDERHRLKGIADTAHLGISWLDRRFCQACLGKLLKLLQ